MKQMHASILKLTLILGGLFSLAFTFIDGISGLIGVWIGMMMGWLGYLMIVRLAYSLSSQADLKTKGMTSYAMRFLVYALVFIVGLWTGFSVWSILAGFLAHKCALLLYAWLERRNENGTTTQ